MPTNKILKKNEYGSPLKPPSPALSYQNKYQKLSLHWVSHCTNGDAKPESTRSYEILMVYLQNAFIHIWLYELESMFGFKLNK